VALTSRITQKLTVPNESESITIRKLSHAQLSLASDAKRDNALAMMKALDGVALPEGDAAAKSVAVAEAEKPENKYDRTSVLCSGITAWSYGVELNADNIADQDEDWAAWAFGEIIAFSVREAEEVKPSAGDSPLTTDQGEGVGQSN